MTRGQSRELGTLILAALFGEVSALMCRLFPKSCRHGMRGGVA